LNNKIIQRSPDTLAEFIGRTPEEECENKKGMGKSVKGRKRREESRWKR